MPPRVQCAFCGRRTRVNPKHKGHGEGARLPHSPTKLGFGTFPPLCVAIKQGEKAQRVSLALPDVELEEVIHHKHSRVCDMVAEIAGVSNTVVHNVGGVGDCDFIPVRYS